MVKIYKFFTPQDIRFLKFYDMFACPYTYMHNSTRIFQLTNCATHARTVVFL